MLLVITIVAFQIAWFSLVSDLAAYDPDKTLGGAYCVFWAIGAVLVFGISMAVGICVERSFWSFVDRIWKPQNYLQSKPEKLDRE